MLIFAENFAASYVPEKPALRIVNCRADAAEIGTLARPFKRTISRHGEL